MRFIVSLALLLMGLPALGHSQEPFASEADLIGTWSIDVQKTRQLWKERGLETFADAVEQMPIARKLKFSKDQLQFPDLAMPMLANTRVDYKVSSFDKDKKHLTLALKQPGNEMSAEIKPQNEDSIVIDWPLSPIGPLSLVYSRSPPRTEVKSFDPLAKIAGEWHLDAQATRAMWKKHATGPKALENFSAWGESAINDAKTIAITGNAIQFSDQSFAPWRFKNHNGSVFTLDNQYYKACYEIHVLAPDVIQLFDRDRYLYAIYKRKPDGKLDLASLPTNKMASSLLPNFREIGPKEKLRQPKRVKVSGDVGIESISVSNFRSTNGGKPQAKVDFTIKIPDKYYAGRDGYFFAFRSLAEIVDEGGTQLKHAMEDSGTGYPLNANACRGSGLNPDGSIDVYFYLNFDAPPRGSKAKELSGEVELFRMQRRNIRFAVDAALLKGPLENPLLEGSDIRPSLSEDRKEFSLKLSKEAKARISSWHLTDVAGEEIQSTSQGGGPSYGYRDGLPEKMYLVIQVLKLTPVKKSTFAFRNIVVP